MVRKIKVKGEIYETAWNGKITMFYMSSVLLTVKSIFTEYNGYVWMRISLEILLIRNENIFTHLCITCRHTPSLAIH
jgi:hypothetical protein